MDRQNRKRRGVDAEPDNAAYVDSLAWVLYRRGKVDEARQELERAIEAARRRRPGHVGPPGGCLPAA